MARPRVQPARASFPGLDGTQACLGRDPELFHPAQSDRRQAEEAKAVCRECPLVRECLAWALTNPEAGVWGATTEAERAALQRAHGLPRRVVWSGAHLNVPAGSDGAPSTDFDDSED
ncbi:WhiB family transcriptional regulator [Cellulomonas soli]|uniref:WhiB family transcriptional regulator n=1 Tax=Cellulomonas soli TaxID=931535 RepID=UPI003F82CD54